MRRQVKFCKIYCQIFDSFIPYSLDFNVMRLLNKFRSTYRPPIFKSWNYTTYKEWNVILNCCSPEYVCSIVIEHLGNRLKASVYFQWGVFFKCVISKGRKCWRWIRWYWYCGRIGWRIEFYKKKKIFKTQLSFPY